MIGYKRSKEQLVVNISREAISEALIAGYNVVVDDTNFNPVHLDALKELVEFLNLGGLEIELTIHKILTTIDTCIANDAKRSPENQVGEKVIKDMAALYREQLT